VFSAVFSNGLAVHPHQAQPGRRLRLNVKTFQ
jgi:hypothetical protein